MMGLELEDPLVHAQLLATRSAHHSLAHAFATRHRPVRVATPRDVCYHQILARD